MNLSTTAGTGARRTPSPWPAGARPRDRRRLSALAIVLMHLLLGWALWHAAPLLDTLPSPAVLTVALVSERVAERLPAAKPAPLLAPPRIGWTATPLPVPTVPDPSPADPTPAVVPQVVAVATPEPPPLPRLPAVEAIRVQAPAPLPPPPSPPRPLPASSIAYLVPPPIELPLASRRLGEQGTVWLRVLVGADGLPRQVSVQRSSGFPRLDEQALSAMRRARFRPQLDNGAPVEWTVIAPLQYEIT